MLSEEQGWLCKVPAWPEMNVHGPCSKIIRIFEMRTADVDSKHGSFLSGPRDGTGCVSLKPAQVKSCVWIRKKNRVQPSKPECVVTPEPMVLHGKQFYLLESFLVVNTGG